MGTREVRRQTDVSETVRPRSRLRLLAPLRYLSIKHEEKQWYDLHLPIIVGVSAWAICLVLAPKLQLFGDNGLLRFTRDLLVMAVPFMVGALASVSMGAPGGSAMDQRMVGVQLVLDGQVVTMRQFVCYLLGYLCLLGLVTLAFVVAASLLRDTVVGWMTGLPALKYGVRAAGMLTLSVLLSALSITVLWALYFLTDIVNRRAT